MRLQKRHVGALVLSAALVLAAGRGAAQTLPNRDDPAWSGVGAAGGADYFVLPSSVVRQGRTVRLLMKATVPPAPDGAVPNTVVAEVVVDCDAATIGTGTLEFYGVTQGFLATRSDEAVPGPASDPGQTLIIQHVCAD